MKRFFTAGLAALVLFLNGLWHGVWSHRWNGWEGAAAQSASVRIDDVPLELGVWKGERQHGESIGIPEEQIGRVVLVKYTDRSDGTVVYAHLSCGPTQAAVVHTPTVCYPANGYKSCRNELTVDPAAASEDGSGSEFKVAEFIREEAGVPTRLRVYWAWSDGGGWRVPGNPGRTYRHSPTLYKCYLTRQLSSPDEPLDGDPCGRLWALLRPQLDRTLFGQP